MKNIFRARYRSAFTLVELSIVLIVLGVLFGIFLKMSTNNADATYYSAANLQMDKIEQALINYRTIYNRLPCPADPTLDTTNSSFGVEGDTIPGDGNCDNANLLQNPAVSPIYKGGAVPTRLLGIPDSQAIDPWGKKIMYVVELDATVSSSFLINSVTSTTFGMLTVYDESGTGTPRTSNALYVLWSAGRNGHGAYLAGAGSTRYNANSTNANELVNCACSSSAVAASPNLSTTFYQTSSTTTDSTDATKSFDDVVRFKTRSQMAVYSETQ